jgi:hypothetical protein
MRNNQTTFALHQVAIAEKGQGRISGFEIFARIQKKMKQGDKIRRVLPQKNYNVLRLE